MTISASGPVVRVYRPTPAPTGLLVYFHGGGWVIGDLDSHDRACRRLAASSGVVVVAVDYRRAPEHPWPAAKATVTVSRLPTSNGSTSSGYPTAPSGPIHA